MLVLMILYWGWVKIMFCEAGLEFLRLLMCLCGLLVSRFLMFWKFCCKIWGYVLVITLIMRLFENRGFDYFMFGLTKSMFCKVSLVCFDVIDGVVLYMTLWNS